MFLIRLALPDRPGSLGLVATAMGTGGADIHAVEVVAREDDRVIDDFMVRLPPGVMPDFIVSACTQVPGVEVIWCSRYPVGAGLQSDMEVLERMLADLDQAPEIFTEAAPVVFHSHWAVLVDRTEGTVIHATQLAPDLTETGLAVVGPLDRARTADLPGGWVPSWVETTIAVVPIGSKRAIIVGRPGGPAFMAAEVARLRYLAALITFAAPDYARAQQRNSTNAQRNIKKKK